MGHAWPLQRDAPRVGPLEDEHATAAAIAIHSQLDIPEHDERWTPVKRGRRRSPPKSGGGGGIEEEGWRLSLRPQTLPPVCDSLLLSSSPNKNYSKVQRSRWHQQERRSHSSASRQHAERDDVTEAEADSASCLSGNVSSPAHRTAKKAPKEEDDDDRAARLKVRQIAIRALRRLASPSYS